MKEIQSERARREREQRCVIFWEIENERERRYRDGLHEREIDIQQKLER